MTPNSAVNEGGGLTDAEAREGLAMLSEHFGVTVAPVSRVCAALSAWGEATGLGRWPTAFEAHKSNLLYRLVYLGEPLRTELCPKHLGVWSGCDLGSSEYGCDCRKVVSPLTGRVYLDWNVCGWLLEGNPPVGAVVLSQPVFGVGGGAAQ